jgi:bifunctional non-homologous end joining protein LigD
LKFDGYRFQAHKDGRSVTLYTRNGADWTERFPYIAGSLGSLACGSAVIDAELVHPMDSSSSIAKCTSASRMT